MVAREVARAAVVREVVGAALARAVVGAAVRAAEAATAVAAAAWAWRRTATAICGCALGELWLGFGETRAAWCRNCDTRATATSVLRSVGSPVSGYRPGRLVVDARHRAPCKWRAVLPVREKQKASRGTVSPQVVPGCESSGI